MFSIINVMPFVAQCRPAMQAALCSDSLQAFNRSARASSLTSCDACPACQACVVYLVRQVPHTTHPNMAENCLASRRLRCITSAVAEVRRDSRARPPRVGSLVLSATDDAHPL